MPWRGCCRRPTRPRRPPTPKNWNSTGRRPRPAGYVAAVRESDIVLALLAGRLSQEWAAAQLVSDDPAKGLDRARAEGLLTHQVGLIFGAPASGWTSCRRTSCPSRPAWTSSPGMQARGVKVRILTNALEANDVAPVHAGYCEMAQVAAGRGRAAVRAETAGEAPTAKEKDKDKAKGFGGSSGSSLHAKTFAADGRRVRGVLQLRPPLGAAEHRTGADHRRVPGSPRPSAPRSTGMSR